MVQDLHGMMNLKKGFNWESTVMRSVNVAARLEDILEEE